MSTFINKKKSAKSNSEPSSNDSSPPASVNLTNGNNMYQVANNNNLNAANNNNNNAPKYGTLVPNRVFVGGISSTTTETELCQLFSKYGNVKATKIIADRAGVSKGYGFVTFETDEEAKRLQLDADNIILKERRLNIAPAIIKQAFPPRGFETTASPPPLAPNIQYLNGVPYTYQNGMAFFLPPQSQAAPIPAAPEAMFQGAGYHTQGPSPTYAAPMLYPVSNPAPMFLSPQHFAQFQQVPVTNQATQVMYAPAGLNTSLQTSNNGAEASSPLQIPSHAPPPFFLTQGEMRPELFYNMASGPQTYPFNAQMMMAVHESQFQYCDISTDQQPNSNASNEVGQQQQFIQGRNMQLPYHAHHPGVATGGGNSMQHVHAHGYAHPHQPQQPQQQHHHQHQSSVPPRRVPNASNRRINHNNNSHQSSSRKRGDIDNGAAGDAPANLMTPPATPSITVTATDQEALCSGVKQINIQ